MNRACIVSYSPAGFPAPDYRVCKVFSSGSDYTERAQVWASVVQDTTQFKNCLWRFEEADIDDGT